MNTIKFSHHYPKLWGQKKATLIYLKEIKAEEVGPTLLEYDTFYTGSGSSHWHYVSPDGETKGYYALPPKGKLLLLVFLGEYNVPFTTIRPYNPQKHAYYIAKINQEFEIKVEEPQ